MDRMKETERQPETRREKKNGINLYRTVASYVYFSVRLLIMMYCLGLSLSLTYSSVTHYGITKVCCAQQSARLYTAALRQYS